MEVIRNDRLIYDCLNKSDVGLILPIGVNQSTNYGIIPHIVLNFKDVDEHILSYPYGDKRLYGSVHEYKNGYLNILLCFCLKQSKIIDIFFEKCLDVIKEKFHYSNYVINSNSDEETKYLSDKLCDNCSIYEHKYESIDTYFYRMYCKYKHMRNEGIITTEEYVKKVNELENIRCNGYIKKIDIDREKNQ